MFSRSLKYLILFLLSGLMAVSSGCSSDSPAIPDEEIENPSEKPDQLTLCVNVSFDSQGAATRTPLDPNDPNSPDGYDDPSGEFEKISSLRVIIVHQMNEDKTEGYVEANRLVLTNDAGRPLYDNLEFRVLANEDKRIYLIANEAYLTSPISGLTPAQFLDTRFAISRDESDAKDLSILANWTQTFPNLSATSTEVTTGLFTPATNRRLPQTEYFDIYIDREAATANDICYSHFFITRAASKAIFYLDASELFKDPENSEAVDELVNSTITAISLNGINATEYLFPNKATYSPAKETLISVKPDPSPARSYKAYINDFSIPENNRTVNYLISGLREEIQWYANDTKKAITNHIYFPESMLEPGKKYEIGVQLNGKNWLYAPLQDNILTVKDGEGIERDAIARDTYLPITIKFTGAAEIKAEVLPWNREDYYVDYTANIGFNDEDYLKITGEPGQTGDYLSLDESTGQLILNYGKSAHGRFFISSPLNTKWDAYLITTGGEQDAIQFQIPDPTDSSKTITTTHLSGEVGKDEASFGIVATVAPGSQRNSAELMVIVTLANGTPVPANVIGNWDCSKNSNIHRLTIIENPQ